MTTHTDFQRFKHIILGHTDAEGDNPERVICCVAHETDEYLRAYLRE